MTIPSVANRIQPQAAVLLGPGDPDSLENRICAALPDGAICFVADQEAIYYFSKFSTASPSGVTIIATGQGTGVPGRWIQLSSGSGSGGAGFLYWAASDVSDDGVLQPWDSGVTGAGSNPNIACICPYAGTLRRLTVQVMSGFITGSATVTLLKNGVTTAITATLSNGESQALDDTNTVVVARGDRITAFITSPGASLAGWAAMIEITP